MGNKDAAFYVANNNETQVVSWNKELCGPFYVQRTNRMWLRVRKNVGANWVHVFTTQQLVDFGVTTDEELLMLEQHKDLFEWFDNPYFEVCSWEDPDLWEAFETLDAAEKRCIELFKEVGGNNVE